MLRFDIVLYRASLSQRERLTMPSSLPLTWANSMYFGIQPPPTSHRYSPALSTYLTRPQPSTLSVIFTSLFTPSSSHSQPRKVLQAVSIPVSCHSRWLSNSYIGRASRMRLVRRTRFVSRHLPGPSSPRGMEVVVLARIVLAVRC